MSLLPLSSLRRFFPVGAFFVSVAGLLAAPDPPAEPVIELPKIVVTDSRELPPPEAWRYAGIPGFEILTNASDKATHDLLRDFQGFNFAVDVVWPGLQYKTAVPVSLIICGRGGKFDAFVPGKENQTDTGRASLILQDREQAAIVLDFEAKTINLASIAAQNAAGDATAAATTDAAAEDGPTAGAPNNGQMEIDHYKQLYREYLRYLMSGAQPRMPPWFEEGLAQMFMGMTFDRHTITFAKLEDPNARSISGAAEDRDFNRALEGRALMPLQELFAVERDSVVANNPLGSVWAKQAQAFVHLCLYGEGQKYQQALIAFLTRLQKEPVSERLFKECFNKSYKDMMIALRGYQQFAAYKSFEWRLPKGQSMPEPPLVALREATQSEVGRIKGDALRLAGHPEAAHTALVAPYIRGERDPRLLAALGLEEAAAGHSDRAQKFLEVAVNAKVSRPRAYLELARLRYEAARAATASGDKLSPDRVISVLDPLFRARPMPPPMPELYTLIAQTWTVSATPPKRDHLEAVLEGVRLFPRNMELVFHATVLASQRGFPAEAAALADLGRKNSTEPADRNRFEVLAAALARDAASADSAKPVKP